MGETIWQRVERRIVQTRDRLAAQGKLLTTDELVGAYESFRARFGPERLAPLTDVELLHLLATRDGTTLPNWLEYEDQGEDAEALFGFIRPLGRRCLGLWFDETEGGWCREARSEEYVRDERSLTRLTEREAFALARSWQQQLLAAFDLIADLPEVAGDAVYLKLQADLEAAAPDLVREAWAHKYLAMCHPGRLSQIHDPKEQRFLLLRALEMPPCAEAAAALAFICGGRYSRMARELAMPMNHLSRSMRTLFGWPHRYWAIETAEKEWQDCVTQGFIDMGWPLLGDLTVHGPIESRRWDRVVSERMFQHYPMAPRRLVLAQLRWLSRFLSRRDVLLAHKGSRVLGLAEVPGPYLFEPSDDHPHRRAVRPLGVEVSEISVRELPKRPIIDLAVYPRVVLAIEEALHAKE
jgi:5-methylcytosine-specific restriction protein B